eukprot:CAMPEP_0184327814 /NCGR_PEP_ID=MMETSP1049-20130417/143292_1 /TAXON_ID=77928 /ORGANISM="Proteomonas sulcata, Strain CCMP704" /LENGTH=181 /DNA_ID=CAMNT_0026650091 /DNA_START=199 /DNA_END=744 /DNA_ORIENTATION=-
MGIRLAHQPLVGAGAGAGMVFACKVGAYHWLLLPLILIELECGELAVLGALDLCTLAVVSAGICLAALLFGNQSDKDLGRRGLAINFGFGDFVEACYPLMDRYPLVNFVSYIAAAAAGALICAKGNVQSSAYLPVPVGLALAGDNSRCWVLAEAGLICGILPFVATVVALIGDRRAEGLRG